MEPKRVVGVDLGHDTGVGALVVAERAPDGTVTIVDARMWKAKHTAATWKTEYMGTPYSPTPLPTDPPWGPSPISAYARSFLRPGGELDTEEAEKIRELWRKSWPASTELRLVRKARAAETSDDDSAFLAELRAIKGKHVGEAGERDPDNPCESFATLVQLGPRTDMPPSRDCGGDGHYLCAECVRYCGEDPFG